MSFSKKLLSAFPVPKFLTMPAVGLDISDHSVKFVEFEGVGVHRHIKRFGTKEIPEGVIVGGTIARRDELIATLASLREEHNIHFVRASLPEEPAYIFTTYVPNVGDDEVRSLLKFKLEESVPIAPAEAVIDFDVSDTAQQEADGERLVTVSVFPEKLAQDYVDLLNAAGLEALSLEIEAQAIARAVVPNMFKDTCMVVDVGRTRSGISIVSDSVVRFTTTVEIGGDGLTAAIEKEMRDASSEDIVALKNTQGLRYGENQVIKTAFMNFARSLRNEIERYYIYWQTHLQAKESKYMKYPNITNIYLCGGHANVAGLDEFLAHELFLNVVRADVWTNVLDVEKDVPPISRPESLGYASAIGLALHEGE
ncbi:MAG: pilus assembly protein PilM [Patescibacteria group bacterium]